MSGGLCTMDQTKGIVEEFWYDILQQTKKYEVLKNSWNQV